MRRWRDIGRGRWVAGGLFTAGVAMLVSALSGERGLARVASLERELAETNGHNFQLVQEINRLQRQLQRIRTDDAALERVARARLSLVRGGEVLYRLERLERLERLPRPEPRLGAAADGRARGGD